MQIQYVLVFVALGVFVKGLRDRRFIGDDGVQIRQNEIDDIARKFEKILQELLQQVEKIKESSITVIWKDLQETAEKFKEKLQTELEIAKQQGTDKEVEKVVTCVKEKQERYMLQFGGTYLNSMFCMNNATKTVKERLKDVNNTFPHYWVGPGHANVMYKKWDQCVTSRNNDCFNDVDEKYMEKIGLVEKAFQKATEKAKDVVRNYKGDTRFCVMTFENNVTKVEETHKKHVKECIKYSGGQKNLTLN